MRSLLLTALDPLEPMTDALHGVVSQAEEQARKGDAKGAAALLTDYLEAHPKETHPYPYYDAGYFLHQTGAHGAAVDYLKKAVEQNPCFNEAWQLLAALYQEADEDRKAGEAMEKAASITRDPDMWLQSAVLYLNGGEPEEALAALKHLQYLRPEKAEWHVAAARAHQELKQNAGAAEEMARAYALSGHPEHLYQCAVLWLDAEKPARALPLLRQLTEMPTPESRWFVALSNALKAMKKKRRRPKPWKRPPLSAGIPTSGFGRPGFGWMPTAPKKPFACWRNYLNGRSLGWNGWRLWPIPI